MARLGQHFLRDERVAERMVELAELGGNDVVLEVGTGDGFLTRFIASTGCRVVTVELDPFLARRAREALREYPNVTVLNGDALSLDLPPFNKVVSSPPYYISTRLLRWLSLRARPELAVLLLQEEFAEKLTAEPGEDRYVLTSLLIRSCYRVEPQFKVGRSAFSPRPKVTSRVVVLRRREDPMTPPESLVDVLRRLFTLRRKKLARALKELGLSCPPELEGLRVRELAPEHLPVLAAHLADELSTRSPPERS
ncbi:MAG: 16S rRNA (adenine(1518)-N(6)/adenine(1519)-N(6))-dimethyltransferase RsmA [Nitrososphaerota archaeon]